jgi:hypothetical protein
VWSALRDVPSVVLDRVNVGGSENAFHPIVAWRGTDGSGTTWTVDGIDVSDPAAPGFTLLFLNTSLLPEVTARLPFEASVRTPGLAVDIRTDSLLQRGGAVFLRGSAGVFEADNRSDTLVERGFAVNEMRHLGEAGGRFARTFADGRVQAGFGAAYSQLRQGTFTGHEDRQRLLTVVARGRAHLGTNHLSLTWLHTDKRHRDRDPSLSAAPESRWRQATPAHVLAFAVERPLTRSVSGRLTLGLVDAKLHLEPQGGTEASAFEDFRGVFRGSYLTLRSHRRRYQTDVGVAAHGRRGRTWLTFRGGASLRVTPVTMESSWPGNEALGLERSQVFFRAFELTGFAFATRDQRVRPSLTQAGLHAELGLTRGRLGASIGLRLDRTSGHARSVSVPGNPQFSDLLPPVSFPGTSARFSWLDLLPRLALHWTPDGADALRFYAAYGLFADALAADEATFDAPVRDVASYSFFWRDDDRDHVVDGSEVDRRNGPLGASGLDPNRPESPVGIHAIDARLRSPLTHEWTFGASLRSGRTRAEVRTYYRQYHRALWTPLRGLTIGDYAIEGAVRGQLFGDGYSVGFYAPINVSRLTPGFGRELTNRPGYYRDAWGSEINVSTERGPARLLLWAALCDGFEYFSEDEGIQDPTPTESEPLRSGGRLAVRGGGLGRSDVFVNTRWSGGAILTTRLPGQLAGTLLAQAREGFPVPYFQVASTSDPAAGAKNVLVSSQLDRYRLPALFELHARLERAVVLPSGRLTLGADVFNLLNSATLLQRSRDVELPAFSRPREILRPRILRLGVEYSF